MAKWPESKVNLRTPGRQIRDGLDEGHACLRTPSAMRHPTHDANDRVAPSVSSSQVHEALGLLILLEDLQYCSAHEALATVSLAVKG